MVLYCVGARKRRTAGTRRNRFCCKQGKLDHDSTPSVGCSGSWKNGSDVSSLAGNPIRLRFRLKDADLFALQFVK
jgi:hypothetical protein